jgi:hypothetical protein
MEKQKASQAPASRAGPALGGDPEEFSVLVAQLGSQPSVW